MESIRCDGTDFFIIQDGKEVKLDIPVEGMLGLLAYGDLGLLAWRNVRKEARKVREENNQKQKENVNGEE
jgi:hypothetical protein